MSRKLDEYWEFLVENAVATRDEILLVTKINGYTRKTLNDILFVKTGFRSEQQYKEAYS